MAKPAGLRRSLAPADAQSPGGCDFLEDPALDARTAEPVWLPDPEPLVAVSPAIVDGAVRPSASGRCRVARTWSMTAADC